MPIVTIQSPTGEEIQIEAPEGATDEQIFSFAKSQGLFNQQAAQPPQQFNNEDVPTEANLALEQARVDALPPSSFMDELIGVGDAALTTVTGATGGASRLHRERRAEAAPQCRFPNGTVPHRSANLGAGPGSCRSRRCRQ